MMDEYDNGELEMQYVAIKREIQEITEAMVSAEDDEFTMMLKLLKKKEKQLQDVGLKLGMYGSQDLSPRQMRKLRKSLGLDDERI